MPYTIAYIDTEGGLIVTWTGNINEEEMVRSYRERFTPLERFSNLRYILADCSNISKFDISPRTIQAIAQISNQAAPFNRNLYFVWAMSSDIQFALGRMWQSYADDSVTGWHSWVARKREEAEAWLRTNLDGALRFGADHTANPGESAAE